MTWVLFLCCWFYSSSAILAFLVLLLACSISTTLFPLVTIAQQSWKTREVCHQEQILCIIDREDNNMVCGDHEKRIYLESVSIRTSQKPKESVIPSVLVWMLLLSETREKYPALKYEFFSLWWCSDMFVHELSLALVTLMDVLHCMPIRNCFFTCNYIPFRCATIENFCLIDNRPFQWFCYQCTHAPIACLLIISLEVRNMRAIFVWKPINLKN